MPASLTLHEIYAEAEVPVPLPAIFLFIFAAPWLTGQIVAMECAVGQKERRSRNSVTSWRGLTLFLPPLTLFVHPTAAAPSSYLILCLSPSEARFSLCSLTLFSLSGCCVLMQAQVLLLGLSFLSIYIFLACNSTGIHTHTHWQTGMCGNHPLATSVTCIWSWWGAKEPTDPGENMQMGEAG